jgi:hypothetical protein
MCRFLQPGCAQLVDLLRARETLSMYNVHLSPPGSGIIPETAQLMEVMVNTAA